MNALLFSSFATLNSVNKLKFGEMVFCHNIAVIALYIISLIFSLSFNSCVPSKQNAATAISKISYSSSGGRSGNYESLEISPDSLLYVQGHRGVEKTVKQKTANAFWNGLMRGLNLNEFDKIRSNPGHALYDGIDITIAVETGKERHSIVNGNEDTVNYTKIRPFTDLLEKKLEALRMEIAW
jgi:hypothetical protein